MFTKLESTIRASFNARLLALEEQVSELAQSVHMHLNLLPHLPD